jgi:hypothetical protein
MAMLDENTTREQLAAVVVAKLSEHKIDAVLVGGSVVSFYTRNKYESYDLDFITAADHKRVKAAMSELGFTAKGRNFVHAECRYSVEFPPGPIGLGGDEPVKPEGAQEIEGVTVKMLSPTQSIMDRLSSFFHWDDRMCLDQALWIAEQQPFNMDELTAWAKREGREDKFRVFLNRLQK